MTNVENTAVSCIRLSDYQILTNGVRTFTGDRRFKLVHSAGSSDWTLELASVSQKDEGGYQCQVRVINQSVSQSVTTCDIFNYLIKYFCVHLYNLEIFQST